jgi:hypothetical protein
MIDAYDLSYCVDAYDVFMWSNMSLVAHAYDVLLPFYMVINLSSPPPPSLYVTIIFLLTEAVGT